MNKRRSIFYLVGLFLGFVILVVTQMPAAQVKMVVCDVGQGDAILIIKGSNQVLIDGGSSNEKILSCLGEHIPFWDRTIELIVLTNTDNDHMHGLGAVIERYQVMQFVTGDGVHSSSALTHFAQILSGHRVVPKPIERGDTISVGKGGELHFEVLWPGVTDPDYLAVFSDQIDPAEREQILGASAKRGDLNEMSVVLLLLEDNKRVLLTGDAGFQTEKRLLELGGLPAIDILKVGHHGSKYASSLEFLERIKPSLAVISVGEKNTYGHPTQETLERLSKIGAKVMRTDQDGTIVLDL